MIGRLLSEILMRKVLPLILNGIGLAGMPAKPLKSKKTVLAGAPQIIGAVLIFAPKIQHTQSNGAKFRYDTCVHTDSWKFPHHIQDELNSITISCVYRKKALRFNIVIPRTLVYISGEIYPYFFFLQMR